MELGELESVELDIVSGGDPDPRERVGSCVEVVMELGELESVELDIVSGGSCVEVVESLAKVSSAKKYK